MKFISWNVNGIRACIKKGFLDFLNKESPDCICLQEVKCNALDLFLPDYRIFLNPAEKKGYSGTAIFTKKDPLNVKFGMDVEKHDSEGRLITLEFEKFFLVNVYTPNVKRTLERLSYRVQWEKSFRKFLSGLNKPIVLCGDLNVAHNDLDLKNFKANRGNAGFTDEERGAFGKLLDLGFHDTFRLLYPDKEGAYTWWSYRSGVRERNIGWRIDYFLVSSELKSWTDGVKIYSEVYGSDHCPIGLKLSDF
jgi:exodeoxyribonuclease III